MATVYRLCADGVSFRLAANGTDKRISAASTAAGTPDAPSTPVAVDNHNLTVTLTFTPGNQNAGGTSTSCNATGSLGDNGVGGAGNFIVVTIDSSRKGLSQTWVVSQTNSAGVGSISAGSNAISPTTLPGAPTSVFSSLFASGTINVSGTAPADNGGTTILGYVADDGLGGHTSALGAKPRPVAGLTNGVARTPRLAAVNAVGQGAWGTAGASVTPLNVVTMLRECPYLSTDTLGTKTYQLYDADGVAIGSPVTTGFVDAGDGDILNAWDVEILVTITNPDGSFAGFAVFTNINGTEARVIAVNHPPTTYPTVITECVIKQFLTIDTISNPGYKVREIGGVFGAVITAGVTAVPGVTGAYFVKRELGPDIYGGSQQTLIWKSST